MYYAQVAQTAQAAPPRMQKTNLIQKSITDVSDALRTFETGMSDTNVPIVLIPDDRCCCSCCMTIPSGPNSIMHSWGKDHLEGLAPAGCQCAGPWERVAYCVTGTAVTYNAPVKSCPTADNVMVDVDVAILLQIGPDPEEVKMFCYRLGAKRFDEFMYAAVEESIRHLMRASLHTEVYELKGTSDPRVLKTMQELQKKFNVFGVHFQNMAILDVRFKPELQGTLQETTNIDARIKEQIKKQKNQLDEIKFRTNREISELQKTNTRVIQDLQAHRTRVEIERQKKQVEVHSLAEVKITNAKEEATVAETRAASEFAVARNRGLKHKEDILAKALASSAERRVEVDMECKNLIYAAEMNLKAAEDESKAIILEANAEGAAKESLAALRNHRLQLQKIDAIKDISTDSKVLISGALGDNLLGELVGGDLLNQIKVKV